MLVTLLSGFIQCCCLCCCRKSILQKQLKKRSIKKNKRTWVLAFILGLILSWITFSGILLASSTYVTASIQFVKSSIPFVFVDIQNLMEALNPSVGKSIDSIDVKIQTCSNGFTSLIDYQQLNASTTIPMLALANDIDQTQVNITTIKSNANAITTLKQNLINSISQINSNGAQIISLIDALSSSGYTITNNNGWTWVLKNSISTGALSSALTQAVTVTVPDTSTTFSSLNTLNLTSFGSDIRTTANNITFSVNSTVYTKIHGLDFFTCTFNHTIRCEYRFIG